MEVYLTGKISSWPGPGSTSAQVEVEVKQDTRAMALILEGLEKNPFAHFSLMTLFPDPTRAKGQPQPYNRSLALKVLEQNEAGMVELQTGPTQPLPMRGSFARGSSRDVLLLAAGNKYLPMLDQPQLFSYIEELAHLFPTFKQAQVQTDSKINQFYEENDLGWLPPPFEEFLSWYHLISPLAYKPYFSREEMLAIPAYRVREVGAEEGDGKEGWIEVITYEDPLSYKEPATRKRIVELTHYLNAWRHDHNGSDLETGIGKDEAQAKSAVEVA